MDSTRQVNGRFATCPAVAACGAMFSNLNGHGVEFAGSVGQKGKTALKGTVLNSPAIFRRGS